MTLSSISVRTAMGKTYLDMVTTDPNNRLWGSYMKGSTALLLGNPNLVLLFMLTVDLFNTERMDRYICEALT